MSYLALILFLFLNGLSEAGELWTRYDFPFSTNCISGDSNYLWIGTTGSKIIRINKADWSQTIYSPANDSIGYNIQYIAADSSGLVFAGNSSWISMFENSMWKRFHNNENGLMGSDLRGIKTGNDNKIWIGVNDSYIEYIQNVGYTVYKQSIQYYNSKESSWKSIFTSSQSIKMEGNWGMYISNIRKNISCLDVADSSYWAYGRESVYYQHLLLNNGISLVYIDDVHIPSEIYNVTLTNNTKKIIYIFAMFSDGVERLVFGEYGIIFQQKIWSILSPPIQGFAHTKVPLEVGQSNNKWFIDRDESNNKYLIKYDDTNYIPYTCPDWTPATGITCLYADDQGFIWVGTQSDGLFRFDGKNATIVQAAHQLPAEFTLSAAYPNPFNAQTTISFTLTKPSKVNLSIYSLTGQKVRELAAGNYSAGKHTALWDGKNEKGESVSSGLYLARMESGGISKVVRMAMVK